MVRHRLTTRTLAVLVLAAGCSTAPTTIERIEPDKLFYGEVLSRGFQPMEHEQIVKLVTGADLTWEAYGGPHRYSFMTNLKPDGTHLVRVLALGGSAGTGSFHGRWLARRNGQFCVHYDVSGFQNGYCARLIQVGGRYFSYVGRRPGIEMRFTPTNSSPGPN